MSDALSYRSSRRELLTKIYLDLNPDISIQKKSSQTILSILERIHAFATIVDDMLDGDEFRKGFPTFFVRHGNGKAAFTSVALVIDLISRLHNLLRNDGDKFEDIMESLWNMVTAEGADIGLIPRDLPQSPIDWYTSVVSKKISWEMTILYRLTCDLDKHHPLHHTTVRLGQLIQACNDYRDLYINDPSSRRANRGMVLTYSLPFSVLLEETDQTDFEESQLGCDMTEDQYKLFIKYINENKIKKSCREYIKTLEEDVKTSITFCDISSAYRLNELVLSIVDFSFWSDHENSFSVFI